MSDVEQVTIQPGPALPAVAVGIAMGCLTFVVGTFLGAAIAPKKDLGWGAVYAVVPSIAAGVAMAQLHRTNPRLSARIVSVTTGAQLQPVR
jgi:hypothetical protein